MNDVIEFNIFQFSIIYVLLFLVLLVLKKSKINQTKLLIVASIRMTIQLVLAGFILTYIFKTPNPVFVVIYILAMMAMSVYVVLSRNKYLNKDFAIIIALSLILTDLFIIIFFIMIIVRVSLFNPQYTIPISGMIMGNAVTGVSLGVKTFFDSLKSQKNKIDALINIGATPKSILMPFVSKSLETALIPTLNSMLGMGIISLPGMMTGQILSGTVPTTAIMYQICIIIAIATVVCFSVFCSLYFGCKTLFNSKNQFNMIQF